MSNSTSSITRKVLMALSGFFLMFFLLQHLAINLLSVFSPDAFNATSHFMGTNPFIQFAMQPVLIFGTIFHLAMGVYLELQNKAARPVKYAFEKPGVSSTWMSRNMIYTGLMIFAFLALHFYDFWIPEISHKYIHFLPEDPTRYYHELKLKFVSPIRVALYVVAFVSLALHLLHGFQSAFQSVGFRHTKYTPIIKKLSFLYAIAIPVGFAFVAIAHFICNNLN